MDTLPMVSRKLGIKPLPKTERQLKTIKQLAQRKDISEAVIATDTGREGELTARWILGYVHFNRPVKRLWISSQTDEAIKAGFKQLRPAKEHDVLYESALIRAKADWLVGLNMTRALAMKYADNLSAGRVQAPTLALTKDRERKIEQFRPQTYFTVTSQAGKKRAKMLQKNQFALKTQEEVQELVQLISTSKGTIIEVQEKLKTESAPSPYDLTEIQREAN